MILKAVATRLRSELRSDDDICRLGGDEFVCVLSQPASVDQVRTIAARLRKSVARPYSFDGEDYIIGCSVGVCMDPAHGEAPTCCSRLRTAPCTVRKRRAAASGKR